MSLFSKILGGASAIAGVATGNPAMAIGGLSSLVSGGAKDPNNVAANQPASFLNLDVSSIDPNFKNPAGYQPTTVKAPILPEDIATYTAVNKGPTYGQTQQRAQLDDSRALLEGILNPDSELNKRIAASATQVARGDFLRNLRDMQAADRKARTIGRPALFGDERGDENVSRMLMNNAQESMYKGRATANDLLNQAYTNSNNLATGFGNLAQTQMNNRKMVDESNRYAIGQQRENTDTRVRQQRDDIYNMLKLADPQRSSMAQSQSSSVANKNANNAGFVQGMMDLAKTPSVNNYLGQAGNYISDAFNGYTDLGNAMPWLS